MFKSNKGPKVWNWTKYILQPTFNSKCKNRYHKYTTQCLKKCKSLYFVCCKNSYNQRQYRCKNSKQYCDWQIIPKCNIYEPCKPRKEQYKDKRKYTHEKHSIKKVT